jgi:hypothetical protein
MKELVVVAGGGGFYLVHVAVHGNPYTIFGYKGKQVRDQIHIYDAIRALEGFALAPPLVRLTTWAAGGTMRPRRLSASG